MADSHDAARAVDPAAGTTIADGLAVRVAIPFAVERVQTAVDRMVRVSERAIAEALATCHDAGVEVEPSASAAVAGLRELPDIAAGGPVVLVMTGRNVDDALVKRAHDDLESFLA